MTMYVRGIGLGLGAHGTHNRENPDLPKSEDTGRRGGRLAKRSEAEKRLAAPLRLSSRGLG